MAVRGDRTRKHTHRQHRVLRSVRIRHHVEQGHRTVSCPTMLSVIRDEGFSFFLFTKHYKTVQNLHTQTHILIKYKSYKIGLHGDN